MLLLLNQLQLLRQLVHNQMFLVLEGRMDLLQLLQVVERVHLPIHGRQVAELPLQLLV